MTDPSSNSPVDGSGSPGRPGSGSSSQDEFLARVQAALAPRYEVERMVGWGGMAAVFRAREPRLDRVVAIKVMSPRVMADSSMVERFAHEARTTAQLSSPYVVTIFDVGETEGLHYIVMRFVGGRTLARVMEWGRAPVSLPVARAWLAQVGLALSHAHLRGVIHRDVKPSNILLDREGAALVSDFGIAKLTLGDPQLTRTGQIVGTPAYMSPEQCMGDPATPLSDQYALGAVAYQLLTGAPPFTGSTLQVLNAQVRDQPPAILELRPECPADLARGIERMLAKRPDDRWTDVSQALDALELTGPRPSAPIWRELAALAAPAVELQLERGETEKLEPGEEGRLLAMPVDDAGTPLPDRRVEWESSEPGVLEVDDQGGLRGISPGVAVISVRCEEALAREPVAVVAVTRPSPPPPTPSSAPSPMSGSSSDAPPGLGSSGPHTDPLGQEEASSSAEASASRQGPGPESQESGAGWDPGEGKDSRRPGRGMLTAVGFGAGVGLVVLLGVGAWALMGDRGESAPPDAAMLEEAGDPVEAEVREGETGALATSVQAGAEDSGPELAPPVESPVEEEPEPEPTAVEPSPASDPSPTEPEAAEPEPPPTPAEVDEGGEPDLAPAPPDAPNEDPAPPMEDEPAPPPSEAEVEDDLAVIASLIRGFAEAVADQDPAAMAEAYPRFEGEEGWWTFGDALDQEVTRTVNLVPRSEVIPIGATATVVFSMTVTLADEEGEPVDEETFPLTMRFDREGRGWVLADLR
jgi:serine/threonine protein kinase